MTFPAGGTRTVRFAAVSPDDSLGAIIDDVSMLVCFGAGTRIDTEAGLVAAGRLRPGDRVWTLDAGFQPIRRCARSALPPARFARGAPSDR